MIYDELFNKTYKVMRTLGVFAVSGKNPPALMGTHSAAMGSMWGKPIFILPVRYTRDTHMAIEETGEFTISVPLHDMSSEMDECIRLRTEKTDLFEALHLHASPAKELDTFTVGDCGIYFECKVLFRAGMEAFAMAPELLHDIYPTRDFHTFYFGEIISAREDA